MKKITTRIFGTYDPYLSDVGVSTVSDEYNKSRNYKAIKEMEKTYITEKWNYMRKFF